MPALLEMMHCIEASEALDDPANVVERPAAAVAPAVGCSLMATDAEVSHPPRWRSTLISAS
jgi:hypothetical protein